MTISSVLARTCGSLVVSYHGLTIIVIAETEHEEITVNGIIAGSPPVHPLLSLGIIVPWYAMTIAV